MNSVLIIIVQLHNERFKVLSKFVIFGTVRKSSKSKPFLMSFSPSQWQSRSLPKELLWNETGEFATVGSSKKFTKSKPFLVFFGFTVPVKKPSKRMFFE
jgi:hypothetical protein